MQNITIHGNMIQVPSGAEPIMIISDTHIKTTVQGLNSGDNLKAVCFTTNLSGLSNLSHIVGFKVY